MLGAMESTYWRGLPKDQGGDSVTEIELIRSTLEEKGQQIRDVEAFRARGQDEADVVGAHAHLQAATTLSALESTARDRKNVFAALPEAVKTHSPVAHQSCAL
jgi:methylmalonyl-CoA mutase